MDPAPTVSFDNTQIAFAAKSNAQLTKDYWLFRSMNSNFLVQFGTRALASAFKLKLPIKWMIKGTLYDHFCGGESIAECEETIQHLNEYKIGTILDYSVEGSSREEDFDNCAAEVMATVDKARNNPAIPFCVFKITGVARFGLLEKLDEGMPLSAKEQEEYDRVKKRVLRICQEAADANVRIFIDAEETWIQYTIDRLAYEMMELFNKEKAIVFNTIQMYRTEGFLLLKKAHQAALDGTYSLGIKLVRGAYMEKERKRAQELGYPSPIQPDKESTDSDFDDALRYCMDNVDTIALCAGTHNEQSSKLLTELLSIAKLPKNHDNVYFAQLLGMSDHISYNLANLGYNVAKYVPYGPVEAVLPYLFRRAQENTSISGQTSRELSLLMKEKGRRKAAF